MANTFNVTILKEHVHEKDIEHLEDKLTIYFQRLKTGCDVDTVSQLDTDETISFSFRFTVQNEEEHDSKEKERKEKEGI